MVGRRLRGSLMKSLGRLAAAAACVVVAINVAGCSHRGAPSGPLSRSQLIGRLLTSDSMPAGIQVLDLGGDDPSADSSAPPPTTPLTCADLFTAPVLLFHDPAAVPTDRVTVAFDGNTSSGQRWRGAEALWSFPSGGAHHALADLRALVGRCPSYKNLADTGALVSLFTISNGPDLGDESVSLHTVTRPDGDPRPAHVEQNVIIIRSGDVLIMVDELPHPSTATPIDDVAAAAY